MKLRFKHIFFLALAALFSNGTIHAQKTDSREGEIVMSQAQLDTFLTKLAEKRRAFLANRKKDQKDLEDLKTDRLKDQQSYMRDSYRSERRNEYSGQERRSSSYDEDRLYREFARINDRIDNLFVIMSNRGSGGTSSSDAPSQPQIIYEQQQQPTYAPPEPDQGTSSTRERSPRNTEKKQTPQNMIAPKAKAAADTTGNADIRDLQMRINEMDEKMRVLDKLGETTGSDEYDKESEDLQKRIDELNQELEAKQKAIDEQNEANKALGEFKNFSKTVYFGNNSSSLKSSDVKDLEEIVQLVKDNKPNLTVALHGFSSKSGSAEYNEKLSFRRAESVKKALLDAGLSSKDLLIMNHGVDAEGSADQARRVEINLIVN